MFIKTIYNRHSKKSSKERRKKDDGDCCLSGKCMVFVVSYVAFFFHASLLLCVNRNHANYVKTAFTLCSLLLSHSIIDLAVNNRRKACVLVNVDDCFV